MVDSIALHCECFYDFLSPEENNLFEGKALSNFTSFLSYSCLLDVKSQPYEKRNFLYIKGKCYNYYSIRTIIETNSPGKRLCGAQKVPCLTMNITQIIRQKYEKNL